jgi:vancomycin resistance protein YoaR
MLYTNTMLPKLLRSPLTYLLILIILSLTLVTWQELYYRHRIFPNVYIGDTNLGNLTKSQAEQILTTKLQPRQNQTFTLSIQDSDLQSIQLTPQLVHYDFPLLVESAYQVGRQDSYLSNLSRRFSLHFGSIHLPLDYDFDQLTLDTILADTLRPFETTPISSRIKYQQNRVFATLSRPGRLADRTALMDQIQAFLNNESTNTLLVVEFEDVQPDFTPESTARAVTQTQIALARPITISSEEYGYSKTLNAPEIFNLIDYEYNPDTNLVEASIANYKLAQFVTDASALIDIQPQEGNGQQIGSVLVITQPARPGRQVDTNQLTQSLQAAVFDSSLPTEIPIPIVSIQPALSNAVANEYGITDLLATGSSTFQGSSAGRLHNITTAATKLHGHLIAPNTTFSMYRAIGNIEKTTGFVDSVIIKNGRTVPGVGGGVCQVSTTLYRAALNAGLPITERRPHSFRVGYYEQDRPPGFDAAIYFPNWDFKFHNDTSHHIVIQSILDPNASTLDFKFWGVSDGRTVEILPPEISNIIPPPPPVRIPSNSVPSGIIRQTEFAADGSTVQVTRHITTIDNTTKTDVHLSRYRPWQAVYLIGTAN